MEMQECETGDKPNEAAGGPPSAEMQAQQAELERLIVRLLLSVWKEEQEAALQAPEVLGDDQSTDVVP